MGLDLERYYQGDEVANLSSDHSCTSLIGPIAHVGKEEYHSKGYGCADCGQGVCCCSVETE